MLSKETRDVYDLFELLYLMEKNGYMSKDRYWKEYILESYNVSNDIHLDMFFGDGIDDEYNEYHQEVRRLLNIEEDENVLMKVCW